MGRKNNEPQIVPGFSFTPVRWDNRYRTYVAINIRPVALDTVLRANLGYHHFDIATAMR